MFGVYSYAQTYTIAQSGNAAPGYFLISPAKSDTLGVIDNYGQPVFPLNVGMQINLTSYKSRELTYFGVTNTGGTLGLAAYIRMNAKQQITDSIFPIGPYQADFHEGFAASDSTFIILSMYRVKTDLSSYVPGGQKDAEVIGGVIQEISRSGRVLFEWKSFDHIPYSDAAEDTDFTQSVIDVLHINSIIRDTDGGLILSCRHLDEIIKIHGTTGKIIWRLGGSKSKNNQFRFLNDTVGSFFGFSHQHSVSRTSRGTLLVFDNGNLKPLPRTSRVVEYEINEKDKTARKVFEYSPAQSVFAATMGNATELPNGNILVGYGAALNTNSTPSEIAAHEIDRTGRVVATVNNLPLPRLNAYRILKSTYGMTGVQLAMNKTGIVELANTDSSTSLSMQITTLKKPVIVTAEKHHYAPRNISYASPTTLFYPPVRWAIRFDDTTAATGTMKLRLDNTKDLLDPSSVTLVHRPVEGKGAFSIVTGTYSSADKSWTLPSIKHGEFAVAYTTRLLPELVHPVNGSTNVQQKTLFRWNKLLFATSYELQISRDSSFAKDVAVYTASDTTYTPPTLRNNTTFWWRIRKQTSQGMSSWSAAWKFTTEFNSPLITAPDTALVPAVVNQFTQFKWRSVEGATRYNVVFRDSAGIVLLDTTQADTVCLPVPYLPADMKITWNVSAIIDSASSRPSNSAIIATVPKQPQLVTPEPNVMLFPSASVVLRWLPVGETRPHRLIVKSIGNNSILVDTTLQATVFEFSSIEPEKDYEWSCASIGRYGASITSTRRFSMARSASLDKPFIEAPVERNQLPFLQPVLCAWKSVNGALSYHVQAARDVVFDSPVVDTVLSGVSTDVLFSEASSLYAWRVQARNGYDVSPWSDTVYVSTRLDSNVVLTPTYPLHGTRTAKESDVFRFATDSSFTGFEVQVSQDPRFASIDYKLFCFTDSTEYTFLVNGARYYWRILGSYGPGKQFLSQTSTMVVNSEVGVSEDRLKAIDIDIVRLDNTISLTNNGLERITGVYVYDYVGRRISLSNIVHAGGRSVFQMDFSGPCFIVVTFSSGKTYFMRA